MNADQNINPQEALAAVFGEPKQVADGITAFGPVIYAYTRKQAVADGVQVDVTKTAQEAGLQFALANNRFWGTHLVGLGKPIKFPMFLTRAVWEAYVALPAGGSAQAPGQDEAGRLWDVVWMTRFGILRRPPGCTRIPVAMYVRNDNRAARLVKLIATCSALDMDDPQPAITVMMPDED